MEKCLAGRVTSVSVGSTKDDIIGHLVGLGENETSKAMDKGLVAEILGKIQKKNQKRTMGQRYWKPGPALSTNRYASKLLLVSLNIEAILHESTIYQKRQKPSKMTDGLELGMFTVQRSNG